MQEMWEIQVQSLGQEDPLEKGMATHCSILAWRIPLTEELGGLQSMGSHTEWDMTEVTQQQEQHTLVKQCSKTCMLGFSIT